MQPDTHDLKSEVNIPHPLRSFKSISRKTFGFPSKGYWNVFSHGSYRGPPALGEGAVPWGGQPGGADSGALSVHLEPRAFSARGPLGTSGPSPRCPPADGHRVPRASPSDLYPLLLSVFPKAAGKPQPSERNLLFLRKEGGRREGEEKNLFQLLQGSLRCISRVTRASPFLHTMRSAHPVCRTFRHTEACSISPFSPPHAQQTSAPRGWTTAKAPPGPPDGLCLHSGWKAALRCR